METTYRLTQTGKQVQDLLDQVTPNKNAIATETENREQAVGNETERAQQAEQQLQENIDAEERRALEAEQQLQDNIDAIEQSGGAAVTAERERAEQAEQTLQDNIDTEEADRIADVDAEEARAKGKENEIAGDLAGEVTRAEGAEQTLQQHIDAEETRARGAEGTLQTNIDNEAAARQGADSTLQQNIDDEETRAKAAEKKNADDIDAIEEKIPAAASSSNQLADKQFVKSSIQTNTAEFKGTFNSLAELQQVTANANDYGYVVSTDSAGNTVYSLYKYVEGTGWVFEYNLNNSSFTAAEWAAIQSGITALLVSKLMNLPTNDVLQQLIGTKQDRLTFDTQPTQNSLNPVQSGGIYEALGHKQDALEFDQEPTQYSTNPVVSGSLYNIFQAINSLFPAAASSQNKLADKQYVDQTVATAAPDFKGVYTSVEQLNAVTGMTVNDFAFVTSTDSDGNTIYGRYHYSGSAWVLDFSFASNAFTTNQWTAINSGITALLVQKLGDLPTNAELIAALATKQGVLTFDSTPTQGSQNPVTSEGIANAILAAAGVQFVDVQTLPTASSATMGKIYLTPSAQQGQNASDWWVTIYDVNHDPVYYWKQVNTTSVDLSNYYTKQEIDGKVQDINALIGERNVTVAAQSAPTVNTLTYTNALGETANHIVGDKRVVPNQESQSGYDTYILLNISNGEAKWGAAGGGSTDIRQKLWINLNSNQMGDTSLNGVSVKVEADNETILDTTWAGETLFCRISPLKQVVVTVGSKTGYYLASNTQTFESSVAGERTLNFNYETCVVTFQPTSNQGAGDSTIEGATGTINGVAVNYGESLKVAMGQSITVTCDAITNYVTPANYTGTASTAQLTPSLVYQTTLVTISWESNLGTDPVIAAVQATVAGRTVSSGETIKVATGTSVAVVFPDVEGYRTPSIATFTAEGTTVVKPTVQYSTDVYTVSIESNQSDKTDIANVAVTVNDGVEDKTLHDGDTVKIPTGTTPTATATSVTGYRKTITVSSANKTIDVQYDTTLVSVNATSNQSTQQIIDPVLTGLTFEINGTQVAAGTSVKVPTGSALTITSPDIANYAKTVTAAATAEGVSYMATVAYSTTLVTLNMVSDVAGVETSAPTGARGTVSYTGGTDQTIANGEFAKVPTGTAFTVTYVAVTNYGTPTGYSGTAAGTSMTVTKAAYVQGVVVVNISMSDSDSSALALAGATVAINGGTPIAYTGAPIPVAPLSNVVVHFTDVEGYATPADQTFIMPTGTKTVSASYDTTIFTIYVTSNQPSDATIAAKKVSVTYTGLATPKEVGNNGTVKVPTGLTPTATAPDETGYAKEVTVLAASRIITAAYQTTLVSVEMVGENAGVEGAAPTGAQATVSYQGGADQVLTDNTQTAKVPTGTAFTITYAAVSGYATPATYSATASGTSMTATKAKYIYGALQLNVSMSDSDATALASVAPMISINSGTPAAMTGSGGVFTANLEVGDEYEITFNSLVEDGYQTPAAITGTFGGGVETKTATYQTDIYTVYVTSNQSPDATIAAKKVSVSYTGLTTAKEVSNNGTVKVPAGLTPTATADDVTNYAKTVTVLTASRIITAAYETTVISVNMVGENGGVEGAAPTGAQATVSYQGGTDQVLTANNQTANVPTGTAFTITYANVNGYATPATYSATATGTSMTATKATYVYGALQLTVSMSDSDATALASVAPMIAVNSGAPTAMTGSGGVFTANLEVGDTYEITFNSLVDDGYQTPAAITGTFGGGVETKTATYLTTIYTVSVTSNQQSDTPITSKKVSVDYTGLSTPKEVGNSGTVKVPSNLTPTATADDVTNYAKSVSVDSSLHTITAAYQTTVVSVNMVGENGGVEGAAPTGAQATVSYQGGTDQVLTSNAQTAKVPTGTAFTITYATVSGYATPAAYSATAAGTSMTATKATYVYGVLQLTVSMSDSDATDLAKVAPMISINSGTAVAMTGSGGIFTANLETNDTYEITFNSLVADGYQTPSAISGTFLGGVQTETATYLTTILTLTSIVTTKDGNVQGTNPQGVGVTVAYTGQTAPTTLTAINDTVKVPSNLTPTITAETVYGYTATATESSGSITLTYATIAYTLNVGTNQASNTDIALTVIRVSATGISSNGYLDFTGAQSSVEVLVPSGVNPTAACQSGAPSANEYAESITVDTTNHTITAMYSTEVLTISITKDAGDGDLSTCSVAVTNGGTTLGTLTNASPTLKVAYGINYTCTPSALAGYTSPSAVTKNWADTTAKSLTFEYIEQAGFVDLGLPSGKKWAIGNLVKDSQGNYSIGAETDWGTYVSWGNIIGHNEGEGYNFDQTTYDSTPGKQVAANIPSNDAAHDIALATLGTPWHLPTKEDYQELYDNTDSEWVADYNGTGVAGRKFMKKSDHSVYVFFPASGYYNGTSLYNRGTYGNYWSSSFYSATYAYLLYFNSSSVNPQTYNSRRFGFTVRPVQ